MLNAVVIQINRANRQRTLREPSSLDCVLFTKKVERVEIAEDGGEDSSFDGAPTLGGLGVLSDEDEVNYSWVEAGEARIHFAQGYAAPLGNTSDDSSRQDYAEGVLEASIEPIAEVGAPGHFVPGKRMLVAVLIGNGVIVNYEIVDVTGTVNIAPYTRKYLLNPRPDEDVSEDLDQ